MVASAPAAARNASPIFEVLKRELPDPCTLAEIGSGTGLHAARAETELPFVEWHPSELPASLPRLTASLSETAPEIAERAFALDVDQSIGRRGDFDAVFSCNTAHIMSSDSVARMFQRVRELTRGDATFLLYGPFLLDGRYTSEGNAQFDSHLRAKNPAMGLRRIEELEEFAGSAGFSRLRLYGMPSNNLLVVWQRQTKRP
ncbi:MAG: DUF938 domain-containing protein [Woeseiaceae bacterium]|nr:DUF938 domain-containing protein [Woeseiaceae bacterium]